MNKLHGAIMNIPCVNPNAEDNCNLYGQGHRDARHAAAELVSSEKIQCEDEGCLFYNTGATCQPKEKGCVATMPEAKATGQVYGIIDPDYGRIYTMVRKLAWEEGYAIGLHGSFTRDLDLIAVPWEAGRNCKPEKLVARILQATGMTIARTGNPGDKPFGRLVWTLLLPEFGDPRFVDLSIMPATVTP